jgi:hypothetical protein
VNHSTYQDMRSRFWDFSQKGVHILGFWVLREKRRDPYQDIFPYLAELGVHPGNVLRTTPGAQGKQGFKPTKKGSELAHIYSKSLGIASKTLRTAPKKLNREFRPILRCRHGLLRPFGAKNGPKCLCACWLCGPIHVCPYIAKT